MKDSLANWLKKKKNSKINKNELILQRKEARRKNPRQFKSDTNAY